MLEGIPRDLVQLRVRDETERDSCEDEEERGEVDETVVTRDKCHGPNMCAAR